jgi:hypothetical protein
MLGTLASLSLLVRPGVPGALTGDAVRTGALGPAVAGREYGDPGRAAIMLSTNELTSLRDAVGTGWGQAR